MNDRASARSPLAALIGQTSVATFATEVWSRNHLVRRAGDGPDLTRLFTVDDADTLLSSHALRTPFLRIAKDGVVAPASSFTRSGGIGATVGDQVDADQVTRLLVDGSTVVFQGLHRAWPSIQAFTTDLTLDLGHPVQANAYLTPASARGFAAHYDTHDVFVIQLSGSKHWTIHSPVIDVDAGLVEWTQNRSKVESAAATEPVFDGLLEQGDVLYLPRGWIHAARAAEATSLHLTLGVHPYTERHVLDAIIADALADMRVDRSLPVGVDVADPDSLAATIEELRRSVIGALASVKAEDVAARLARRRGQDVRSHPLRPVAQAEAVTSQAGSDPAPVVLREGFMPRVAEHHEGVTLHLDGMELPFRSDHAAALRQIVSGVECRSVALPGLDEVAGRDLIRALLVAGVVVPVGP